MEVVERDGGTYIILSPTFDAELRAAVTQANEAEAAAQIALRKAKSLRDMATILARLHDSWRQKDPGKSEWAYWFHDKRGARVVAKEALEPGVIPGHYPVIPLDQVAMANCPRCNARQPLIEGYRQTRNHINWDQWRKEYLVLCCGTIFILRSETSPYRF